jgi:hypothetical protein
MQVGPPRTLTRLHLPTFGRYAQNMERQQVAQGLGVQIPLMTQ